MLVNHLPAFVKFFLFTVWSHSVFCVTTILLSHCFFWFCEDFFALVSDTLNCAVPDL